MSRRFNSLVAVFLIVLLTALGAACRPLPDVNAPPPTNAIPGGSSDNRNIPYGMPGKASKNAEHRETFLIERPQYVLSYNDMKKSPNWVSWQLVREDCTGDIERGEFKPDPLLPKSFVHVTEAAYGKSGFDRGHMCPSADRTATQEDNDATFYMTNIIPQSPNVNRKAWERMETYCRNLAKQGKELHICCGPWGTGGEGSLGKEDHIGSGKAIINVPEKCWKVIMVLKKGETPNKETRTIAVIMPNTQQVDIHWPKFRVSVKDVEEMTGLHFWPDLPKAVATAIKSRVDETEIHVEPFKKGPKN